MPGRAAIRLKKIDGGVILSFIRADGSTQVQRSGHQGYFALHDLMHYAVESTLGFEQGFMGLMAAGWSFEAFTDHDDPRYHALPAEALIVERLVDILTRAHRDGAWRDEELRALWFEEYEAEIARALAGADPPRHPTHEQILDVCRAFGTLVARWEKTPVGGHLELPWPAGPA